jgi:hypothetical protein
VARFVKAQLLIKPVVCCAAGIWRVIRRQNPLFVRHRTNVTEANDVHYGQGQRTVLNRRFCLFSRPVRIDGRVSVDHAKVATTQSQRLAMSTRLSSSIAGRRLGVHRQKSECRRSSGRHSACYRSGAGKYRDRDLRACMARDTATWLCQDDSCSERS